MASPPAGIFGPVAGAITAPRADSMDIASWLRGLGLERYERVFRENRIGADVLPRLTVEDLKDLGVTLVGDRRRLLDAIAAFGVETPTAAAAPVRAEAERRQLSVVFC